MSFEEAIKKKMISLEIKSLGGHKGNCITMKVKNLQNDTTYLLEPGRTALRGRRRLWTRRRTTACRGKDEGDDGDDGDGDGSIDIA